MNISVQTEKILERLGIEEGFKLISNSGFDSVDFNINSFTNYQSIVEGKPLDFFAKSNEDLVAFFRPYKEAAEKYQVRFGQAHAPFPTYVENERGNEYVLDAIRKSIMVCGYLGCPYIVVHPNFLSYEKTLPAEQEWKINIERFSTLIEDARKHQVTVCLENMFTVRNGRIYAAICADAEETNRYIDALNDLAGEKRFAFCLDTGHALLASKEIYRLIMELGHRIEILHLHDNDGVNDQHYFPYMGVLDWDRVCQGLKDIGYKGSLSFETDGSLRGFDASLMPEMLKLLSATGRIFSSKIES